MNSRLRIIFCVSVCVFLSTINSFVTGTLANEVTKNVMVQFSEPMRPSNVIELVNAFNLSVKELYFDSGEIGGGYSVPESEEIETAIDNLFSRHDEFLRVVLKKIDDSLNGDFENELMLRMNLKLQQQIQFLNNEFVSDRFMLSGMLVENTESLHLLLQQGLVNSIFLTPVIPSLEVSDFNSDSNDTDDDLRSTSHESWAPYSGTSDVTQSYTYQTFYFNKNTFLSISTYEQETQIYDRGFADYNNYWNSNLPSKYLDTTFGDSQEIDNFTVGSSRASSIKTYTQYYTYMSLKKGSASTAPVKIKGQKGFRFPTWCDSTWCIFPDSTTSAMASFTAPSAMCWQY